MERCYLERPSAARKDDILEYLDELRRTGTEDHGTGGLGRILRGWTFEDALERCLGLEDAAYAAAEGRCQGKTFLLVRERDRRIMGTLNVRWNLSEDMRRYAGHIGYGVRPSEQRQGFGKLMLYMGLAEALKVGEPSVIVGCDRTNAPSAKTILALGGVWKRSEDGKEGEIDDFYVIDVPVALEKYAPVCGSFVVEGEPVLLTERLMIDRLGEWDKEDVFANVAHDRQVLETFMCPYAERPEDFDFAPFVGRQSILAIRLKETGRAIGLLTIVGEEGDSCEIGYVIGTAYQNRGFATEAVRCFITYLFEERGFRTVTAGFFAGNEASRRVMEKCGMAFSHVVEKELTYLGVERDVTYYAVSRGQACEGVLQIRRAEPGEFDAVRAFYHAVIDGLATAQYGPGWKKDIYPAPESLAEFIGNGELFVGMDGDDIIAAMVLNHRCNPAYYNYTWPTQAEPDEVTIVHILCVHPAHQGRGLSKQLVQFALDTARQTGQKAVRLDVLEGNVPAERLYEGFGFRYLATMPMFYEDTGWTNYELYEYPL